MKTVEEEYILCKIEEYNRKKMEYLEADKNKLAKRWEDLAYVLENIYSLIQDGYKYRELKTKEKI